MDLVPGGARRNLSDKRAAALLSEVTPTGAPAVIRWQLAVDLVADVRQLEQRIAAVEARIRAAVAHSNTTLVQLFGVGPGGARRARSADRDPAGLERRWTRPWSACAP
jgi:transposase